MNNSNRLRVVITGANGFLGRNVRKLFHDYNVNMVSLSRKNFQSYKFEKKIISNDPFKTASTLKLKHCHALVHLIGEGKQSVASDYQSVNVDLTVKAIDFCKSAKIKKIVYISGLGASRKTSYGYLISKYKAERQVINSRLDYTIFRPSYIIGRNDPLSNNIINQINTGVIKIPGTGKYQLQPIFVEDVGKVIFSAITNKKFSKKIVDLVGPDIIYFKDFVKYFKMKKNVKIHNVKLEHAFYEAIHTSDSTYGIDDLNLLLGNFTSNYKKLKKITGLNFINIKEVLQT